MSPDDGSPLVWRLRHHARAVLSLVSLAILALGAYVVLAGVLRASLQEIAVGMSLIVGGAIVFVAWRRAG